MNSGYGPALRRFWWIVLLGGLVAVLVATLMMYSVEASLPPKFTAREQPLYTAQARLFVTSGEAPYLRTTVPRVREVPIGGGAEAAFTRVNEAPDVSTLVDAANLYPLLIESDEVSRLRTEQSGDIPGDVTAKAIFATATANRFQPSGIPVIELFATTDSPDDAAALATATSKAFRTWIVREQNRAGIDPKERILIQELEAPSEAIATGGGGIGLPVLALLAIITAFGAGAIMLDRTFPRPESDEDMTSSDLAAAGAG
jgi:hypothetical protein